MTNLNTKPGSKLTQHQKTLIAFWFIQSFCSTKSIQISKAYCKPLLLQCFRGLAPGFQCSDERDGEWSKAEEKRGSKSCVLLSNCLKDKGGTKYQARTHFAQKEKKNRNISPASLRRSENRTVVVG